MAERQRSGKKTGTTTREPPTREPDPKLDPTEENAVRMRHGYKLPDDVPLTSKAGGNAALAARLRELEVRAFEQSGRLDEIQKSVEDDDESRATKRKIIDKLKQDD